MKKLIFILLLTILPSLSFSEELSSGEKYAVYTKDMERIENYFNNMTTFVAKFTQYAPDNSVSYGTFYLSRPGKLRWEYEDPNPLLILAKGSLITYYDKELDQVSHIGIDDTLAGFLTREKINFSDGIEITKFTKKPNSISISIVQKDKEDEGQLTLKFSDNGDKVALTGMEVIDAIGKLTSVNFESPTYGTTLANDLFILKRVKQRR